MQKVKNNFKEKFFNKDFLNLALKNLLLILFIIIFVIVFSMIFGSENQLIGVGLITGILMFRKINIGLKRKQVPFLMTFICLLMALCNILSSINIFFNIILNIIAVFILMLFTTIKLHYKTYIPFILLYIFVQDSVILEGRLVYRVLALLTTGLVLGIIHYIYNKNDDDCKNILEVIKEFNLEKDNYVFTIKMTIGIVIAMFFSDLLDIEKGMWISITVMSLTQPHFEITKNRMKQRLTGTLIGFIIYLIIFETFVPSSIFVFITFILSYVYTFIKDYHIQIVFITINSLNAAKGIFGIQNSMVLRISFVILGILIVLSILFLEKKFLDKNVKYDDEEIFNDNVD